MADGTAKPVIFISYSHKDEPKNPGPKDECWLTYVQSHLQPAVKHGIYDLWVDEDIPGGGAWRAEIDKKLAECDVCVLLVSRHSLASDFIIDVEIETLRKRRAKGEADIFPIVLTPCAVKTAPWIKEINLRPPNGQPLSDFEENERNKRMAAIAEEIAGIAEEIAKRKLVPKVFAVEAHMGFGMEILAKAGAGGPDERPHIELSHLPETAYERLVGRDDELKRLDEAWTDSKTNILSLVAEGGAGKSALVNEWLKRLQSKNYRGAETVLGWSFYSQGSKERATSADEFLNWTLDRLGLTVETTSATAKGEAIAEALMKRRVLLVLDGLEPLQYGFDAQLGELKDQGLRALVRRFVATPPANAHGLIVLTSRLAVKDIARWRDGAAPIIDVERLSDEAGAALLRDNGVWGIDRNLRPASHQDSRDASQRNLRAASHAFGGHPLALGLLASFLKETQKGDVRRRDHIRAFFTDPKNPRHDHAKRVMESYEKEWLAGQPALLAIMRMVGLFDRPASGDCLDALRAKPVIEGLTDEIVNLDDSEWQRAIERLREVRLLAPRDPAAPDALDAHPLVREWFGDRLRRTNETAWKAAHGRLYEHLRDTTEEGKTPTLPDLAPLYQAIAHGCCAGRHQEALDQVYAGRISRRHPSGVLEYYSKNIIGAFGSDLAAISWFFDKAYEVPSTKLTEPAKSWIVSEAAAGLVAQTRLSEALATFHASVTREEDSKNWDNAGQAVSGQSEAHLILGQIELALTDGASAIKIGDHGEREGDKLENRVQYATALHAAGRIQEVEKLFAEIERQARKLYPNLEQLISVASAEYTELLSDKGQWIAVRQRAEKSLKFAERSSRILDISLSTLAMGKANLGLALKYGVRGKIASSATPDLIGFSAITKSIRGLRRYGRHNYIPRGLLARIAFYRSVGDWLNAARDLDEVEEIAEPGPMRLFLCDMALERARLAFAKIEAFAPLNGMLENDNPPKPTVPSAGEITELKTEADKQLNIAADYIEKCGYHRRDEELAELQAVLRGERKFADLPPRV